MKTTMIETVKERLGVSTNARMGSARALACCVPRPRGTLDAFRIDDHLAIAASCGPTGEGAGRNTRGRVCSPRRTAFSRLWQDALRAFVFLVVAGSAFQLSAQTFNSGSNGSRGPLDVPAAPPGRSGGINLEVPPDGVFHFTTITIGTGIGVTFTPNALNTPIYLLATGDVTINGSIDVNGKPGSASAGGVGGPGGFDGGHAGSPSLAPGDGLGPGAGRSGDNCPVEIVAGCVGAGSYGIVALGNSTNKGSLYGSPLLIPLIGGSGGGGAPGFGGGGGGGAILVASNTRIQVGGIFANGGAGAANNNINGGSGGAIRLVAPVVLGEISSLRAAGSGFSGAGRIRIDAFDRTGFGTAGPAPSASYGKVMSVFPPVQSRLSIVAAAGQNIPEGANAPVNVMLPFGSDTNQVVRVQARDFTGIVPINVVVTPQNGPRRIFSAEIDMATGNPAIANVPIIIPLNTEAAIHAWTR